jgi:uncharacterized protein YkvS
MLIILAFHLRQKKYDILVYGAVIHSKQGARGIVDKNVQNRDTTILTTIYENCKLLTVNFKSFASQPPKEG